MATRRSRSLPRSILPALRKHKLRLTARTRISSPPTLAAQLDEVFDVQGLARYLRTRDSWVYAETAKGGRSGLPFVKIGKLLRFRKVAIDRWLAQHERTA